MQTALKQAAVPDFGGNLRHGGERPDNGAVCTTSTTVQVSGISARLVQLICVFRKDRQQHFPGRLGSDSCWDVLLHLYAAHLNQHRLSIAEVTRRTGLPGTTVLRAVQSLGDAAMIQRAEDPLDRRRVFVTLSESGVGAMDRYLSSGSRKAIF